MKLDSRKLRLILMGSLGAFILIFIGILFIGSSILSSESRQMVDLKIKSETADLQLSNLEQSKKDVEKYSYFKEVARTVIPNDKNQAQSVLDIFQIADNSGISIQSITFPTSSLGTTVPVPAQDATTSASSKAAISQAKPVTGIPGLYSLELTIAPALEKDVMPDKVITYPKMLDFLSRIEKDRRTAQVTQVNITPGANSTSISFTLTVNIFIKP